MSYDNVSVLVTFLLYLVSMLAIGWIFYRRTNNLSDYILGGRGLNMWVTSLSAQASDMSGWLLLGLPGFAYMAGMEATWLALGLVVGTYLNWKVVAKRLRIYTEIAGNSLTLPDYFENRFRDTSNILRIISAVFILVFFLIYTASGFVAGAKLFNAVFGMPYMWALLISMLVIISYTFLGGFMAVSWTDFFQGMIMFFAVLIVPMMAVRLAGGFTATVDSLATKNPALLDMFTSSDGRALSVTAIISLLAWGGGYFGQPHILARFMAIRSPGQIPRARMVAMVWVIVSLVCAVMIGLVGIVYLKPALPEQDAEKVFMVLVRAVAHPIIGGFLLAAVLAAIMSTADSQLLVTSSVLAEDFYKAFLRKNAKEKELVWISRFAVVGVALVACLVAADPESSVLNLVAYAWGGFGATFGPLIVLSLYWKRMTRNGAVGGIIVGGLTVLVWRNLHGGIFEIYEIVPGFVFSVVAIIVISLLDKAPPREIADEFDTVHGKCA